MTGFTDVFLGLLAVAMVLAVVRLARGPSLADRVVALDLLSTITVAAAGVYSIGYDNTVFLDVAVIIALIAFVGTVGFAVWMGGEGRR
ncbi:MAG: monovalent cation/H+ antiporter complex subunit F [Planctomycetota bacterium]